MMAEIRTGQIYVIETEGNPTTGYCWTYEASEGLKVDSEYTPHISGNGIAGAGGRYVFSVSADAPGTYQLDLFYGRPWEDGPIEIRHYDIFVNG